MAELIDQPDLKPLAGRLPKTFGPAFGDQSRQWALLFPAERRKLRAQIDWLTLLPPEEARRLFAPIVELESRMGLPDWDSSSVLQAGLLARSPLYPQWRTEVEKVFARMDNSIPPSPLALRRRLVACILPAGLPVGKEPLWPELAAKGAWVNLTESFGEQFHKLAAALAGRRLPSETGAIEATWMIGCGEPMRPDQTGATELSWQALEPARKEFLARLNTIQRDLKSVDQTNQELKRIDLARLVPPAIAHDPRVREFVRGLFLSGNGSLVFPNSFVQWGASEAMRRAEPLAVLALFGLRQKLKPFSSTVLFEDQTRSNPVADQDDPAGSLADALMLAQYVYYSALRVDAYRDRTLFLMAVADLSRMLVIGAKPPGDLLTREVLQAFLLGWLN